MIGSLDSPGVTDLIFHRTEGGWFLVAVLVMGVTLAGLILTSSRGLRQDMRQDMARQEARLDERIGALESQISELRERITHEVGELRERMARLEGLLEGLREAITGRPTAR